MQSTAKFGQSLDLAISKHFRVAALQVIEYNLLPDNFARSHKVDILRSQPRCRIELIEGLIQQLCLLQAEPSGKGLVRLLSILSWMDCRRPLRGSPQDKETSGRVVGSSLQKAAAANAKTIRTNVPRRMERL